MNNSFEYFIKQLPFCISLGIVLAFIIGFFTVFIRIILWGTLLGSVLWLFAIVKQLLFPGVRTTAKGRVIDHDSTIECKK